MTSWQLRPGGLYVPPDAADGPYLVQKDGNRFSQWLRLVDGTNTTVVTDPDAGTVQVDSTGGGSGGAGEPHIDTDTATTGADLVMTLTAEPAAPEALLVFWRGVGLDPTQYSYVGTALTVLDQGWTTGDLVWAAYWSEVPTVVTDPTTTLGDILVRGPSGLTRLPVGADGYVLTADSGATDGLDWEPPPGGGSSIWSSILSLPLSTLTGWTAGTGTWAISSGVIRQSSTGAASNRLRYTAAKLNTTACIAEIDIKVDVATSTTLSRVGFLFDYPPGADTTGSVLICLKQGTSGFIDRIYAEYEGVQAGPDITFTPTIALGTYITFRVMKIGRDFACFVNGTLVGQVAINTGNSDASTIALYTYDADASFRNLDLWGLTIDV